MSATTIAGLLLMGCYTTLSRRVALYRTDGGGVSTRPAISVITHKMRRIESDLIMVSATKFSPAYQLTSVSHRLAQCFADVQ
jgi:hypothetical protein